MDKELWEVAFNLGKAEGYMAGYLNALKELREAK